MQKPVIFVSEAMLPAKVPILDAFSSALPELFFIEHPHLKKTMPETGGLLKTFLQKPPVKPCWIYFPWKHLVVKTVDEQTYFRLRTARNRNIITLEEQLNFRSLKLGIAGLSVGSRILHALSTSGGPKHLYIADFDVLEITNLNRIIGNLTQIGRKKIEIAAEHVWELDPFAELVLFTEGLSAENLNDFLLQPKLDIFVDEMDSVDMKIKARAVCQDNGIPVLMATDNGDGVILDIERFDLEPTRPILHGLLGDLRKIDLSNMDYKMWLSLATKIVDPGYLTPRMQTSLLEIGTHIPAVPQLGATASIAGAAIAFAARRIANKQDMPSGRYTFGLEEKLIPGYGNEAASEERARATEKFKALFGTKP